MGTHLIVGQRPADIDNVRLRFIVIYSDRTSEMMNVQIETMSGEIKALIHGRRPDVVPPFLQRFGPGMNFSEEDLDALARQLDPR